MDWMGKKIFDFLFLFSWGQSENYRPLLDNIPYVFWHILSGYYCQNCYKYGSYNGVFIGYCVPCAGMYSYERGNGFLYHGVECLVGNGREAKNSVWNTYLKNVNLEDIGWNSWVEPPFVDDWVSEEAEEHEVEEIFHEVDSIISDDESEYENYHDYVDSESEYFERMYVAKNYIPRNSIYDRTTVKM